MTSSQGNTVGFVSDTSRGESAPEKRYASSSLVWAFLKGYLIGTTIAVALLVLFYLGLIHWTNSHE